MSVYRVVQLLLAIMAFTSCALSTHSVIKGREGEIASIRTIRLGAFQCPDEGIASGVTNGFLQIVLPSSIKVTQGEADAEIAVNIAVQQASGSHFGIFGGGSWSSMVITNASAQIIRNGEIIAVLNAVPTAPAPPSSFGEELGREFLKTVNAKYRNENGLKRSAVHY